MKKNLIKSLKNLLKAYGGENSNKNNAVQIIDEITETLSGENVSKSKNLIEAVDKLSNQVSKNDGGDGGNPNRIQTIIGTFADPWGDVEFETLANAIMNRAATAYISLFNIPIPLSANYIDVGVLRILGMVFSGEENEYPAVSTLFAWDSDHFSAISTNSSTGKCVDATQDISSGETTLTIVWHPLPEASS